jgi:hypothetical protein
MTIGQSASAEGDHGDDRLGRFLNVIREGFEEMVLMVNRTFSSVDKFSDWINLNESQVSRMLQRRPPMRRTAASVNHRNRPVKDSTEAREQFSSRPPRGVSAAANVGLGAGFATRIRYLPIYNFLLLSATNTYVSA